MTAVLAPTSDDAANEANVVLAVDLDGTLCRTDTLQEALLTLLVQEPMRLFSLPFWLVAGRATLKERVADHVIAKPSTLPINESVLEIVTNARKAGRKTALVSASDHRQVTAVAEAVGLFDEAYGTAEGQNLKGPVKAALLTERFGTKGFDYVGNSYADLPVWAGAREAITVGARQRLRDAAEITNPATRHIDMPKKRGRAMLRAIRPHQWSKNLLLFLPILAAHDFSRLLPVVLAFSAFCLTASAVYVINDLFDLTSDRAHPRKKTRPFASGNLNAATGAVMAGLLLTSALVLGLLVGEPAFLGILCLYFATTFMYSLWLKRKLIVDVLMLAGLYTVRAVAGGAAASVELSAWMLGFLLFLFLALAAVKRQAELTDQLMSGRVGSGRAYEIEDLPILRGIGISSSHAAALVLALYISSEDVQALYSKPELLWLIAPIMLYWILRMVLKAHRGLMTDDPIVFAVTDRVSVVVIAICIVIASFAALQA